MGGETTDVRYSLVCQSGAPRRSRLRVKITIYHLLREGHKEFASKPFLTLPSTSKFCENLRTLFVLSINLGNNIELRLVHVLQKTKVKGRPRS